MVNRTSSFLLERCELPEDLGFELVRGVGGGPADEDAGAGFDLGLAFFGEAAHGFVAAFFEADGFGEVADGGAVVAQEKEFFEGGFPGEPELVDGKHFAGDGGEGDVVKGEG